MATVAPNKYALKSLNEEIALFDRKIAHLNKYENFATEQERASAEGKMNSKREQLVRAAKVMTDAGIELDPASLPQATEASAEEQPIAAANLGNQLRPGSEQRADLVSSDSSLDFRNSIMEFKARRKSTRAQA